MQNPYKTPSGNRYELRNLLEYIDQKNTSPRTGKPLSKTDIAPDIYHQSRIMVNISNVENAKDTLLKILKMKQQNKNSLDIDEEFKFIPGSADKIVKLVCQKIYERIDGEFSMIKNIQTKIIDYESNSKLSRQNMEEFKDIYKTCKKRKVFKQEFLSKIKYKFEDMLFLNEVMGFSYDNLYKLKIRYEDQSNRLAARDHDLNKIKDALDYWFLKVEKPTFVTHGEADEDQGQLKQGEILNKSTLNNFFYNPEYTYLDSDKLWCPNKGDKGDYVDMKFVKMVNRRYKEENWTDAIKMLPDEMNNQDKVLNRLWALYKCSSCNEHHMITNSSKNDKKESFYKYVDSSYQFKNVYYEMYNYNQKGNFPVQMNYINDIKLKHKNSFKKEFPMDINYTCIKYDKYYLIGFGYSLKEYKTYNRLYTFDTDKLVWDKVELKREYTGEEERPEGEDEEGTGEEFNLQSPATCIITENGKPGAEQTSTSTLYLFGGYENKNKQLKDMYMFNLSKLSDKNKVISYSLLNYDDKDEIKPRSQSKNMVSIEIEGKDYIYIYGGAYESDDSIVSLSDLNSFDIKNTIMEHIGNIYPPRANHFFEKKGKEELIIAFGFDYETNVPLNDFYVYNIVDKMYYNACCDFNFQPDYNFNWTHYKDNYFIIYGGKVSGMLMVLDMRNLDNSVLQYSNETNQKIKDAGNCVKVVKSNYEVDYSKLPAVEDKDKDKTDDKQKKSGKPKKKANNELKYLSDYKQDRGGIMVSNREMYVLPNYLETTFIKVYDMVFTYDFHLYIN